MYEKVEKCPLCESESLSNYMICKDFMVTGESFALTQCTDCNFIFTNPRPSEANAHKFYDSPKYISHNHKPTSPFEIAYSFIRSYAINKKIDLIQSYVEKGKILDIGCGTGSFLKVIKDRGWDIQGIESNDSANQLVSSKLDVKIQKSIFDLPAKKTYNAITLWHVLEHLYDINDALSHIKKIKAKKGRIFMALPNYQSPDAEYYKEFYLF
jgi:2-polyprenyl-3-methyl-5-hydroxy-6-metoxy-1,4-benzoquinol methylase